MKTYTEMRDELIEASEQARRNKRAKNTQDTLSGHRYNQSLPRQVRLTPDMTGHKFPSEMNKALGRAKRRGETEE